MASTCGDTSLATAAQPWEPVPCNAFRQAGLDVLGRALPQRPITMRSSMPPTWPRVVLPAEFRSCLAGAAYPGQSWWGLYGPLGPSYGAALADDQGWVWPSPGQYRRAHPWWTALAVSGLPPIDYTQAAECTGHRRLSPVVALHVRCHRYPLRRRTTDTGHQLHRKHRATQGLPP